VSRSGVTVARRQFSYNMGCTHLSTNVFTLCGRQRTADVQGRYAVYFALKRPYLYGRAFYLF